MANFKLSPPWCSYYREVEAMFGEDSEVEVVLDDKNYAIKISVNDNSKKCNAIRKLLPAEKQFGNVFKNNVFLTFHPISLIVDLAT